MLVFIHITSYIHVCTNIPGQNVAIVKALLGNKLYSDPVKEVFASQFHNNCKVKQLFIHKLETFWSSDSPLLYCPPAKRHHLLNSTAVDVCRDFIRQQYGNKSI